MLLYNASEKDCVGQDGEGLQECVICFEEFEVGDEMGRLECLCKFHRVRVQVLQFWRRDSMNREGANMRIQACIQQWWVTKGAGACPVHIERET